MLKFAQLLWLLCDALWYSSDSARRFLYAPPTDQTDFALYILKPHRFMVELPNGEPIGTFALEISETNASVGVLISEDHRGMGYLGGIFPHIVETAKTLGIRVLSADIYSDNDAAIRGFENAGFRKFLWFEKNLEYSL